MLPFLLLYFLAPIHPPRSFVATSCTALQKCYAYPRDNTLFYSYVISLHPQASQIKVINTQLPTTSLGIAEPALLTAPLGRIKTLSIRIIVLLAYVE